MLATITDVTPLELRNIMVARAHLNTFISDSNLKRALPALFKNITMIQYDPLNPAGRNHDINLFARLRHYKYAAFESLYADKLVFENYHDNLYAIDIQQYSMYHTFNYKRFERPYYLKHYNSFIEQHPNALESVLTYITDNGMTKSSDLKHLGSVDSHYRLWKTGNVAGNALEYLWLQGKLVVAKRDSNFRKYYDLTENYVPASLLLPVDMSYDDFLFAKLQNKLHAFPLLPLGKQQKNGFSRRKIFHTDWLDRIESGNIAVIRCGTQHYITSGNWADYTSPEFDDELRAIAPLDPLIWDRDILLKVFDFEYKWEVYNKKKDRRWGYYVYPLLYRNKLVGRLEAKYDKQTRVLTIFNVRAESDLSSRDFLQLVKNLGSRWQQMLEADTVQYKFSKK